MSYNVCVLFVHILQCLCFVEACHTMFVFCLCISYNVCVLLRRIIQCLCVLLMHIIQCLCFVDAYTMFVFC